MRLHSDPQYANQRGSVGAGSPRPDPRRYARILGALLVAGALGLALPGCSGGDSGGTTATSGKDKTPNVEGDTSTASTGTAAAPGAPGGGGPPMGPQGMMAGGGPMGMGMGGMGGGMGGMGGGQQQAAANSPVPKVTTPPPHRPDPFRPWFSTE